MPRDIENEEVVDEQGLKYRPLEEEPASEPDDSEDDDEEVDEQMRMSDAALKRELAPIASPLTRLS